MATHAAVVTVAVRGKLEVHQIPTITPSHDEVLVRVEWTASTPLDLHQNDGGLFVKHPQVLGDSIAGTVVQLGEEVKRLKVGDKVFGFAWREQKEKGDQELATISEYLLGIIPPGFTPQQAATLPNNFVTVFYSLTADLNISLPFPLPTPNPAPEHAHTPFLIWGGSSSVGQYALQILRYYGYTNLLTTASPSHHSLLLSLGAAAVFDYRSPDIVSQIKRKTGDKGVGLVLDCIGSKDGSLEIIRQVVEEGCRVAVLLPVIVRDASETVEPVYSMDAESAVTWPEGVIVRGVRTHFYLQNAFHKTHLQPTIMPYFLEHGIVKPNAYRIIEGKTLLERGQNAIDVLRRKGASGERLVWRISE